MRLIDADEISFRCAYNGDCMADKDKCKKCSDYVCDFDTIQRQPTIDNFEQIENNNFGVAVK